MALSVIGVRVGLATMNDGRGGHEVLVHVPRAHDGIAEPQMRYLESADLTGVRFCRGQGGRESAGLILLDRSWPVIVVTLAHQPIQLARPETL